nr:hypothetical protein [Tanacetum cinerariifolium]
MFLNYALMIRQDYDITSSLRRGVLHFMPPKPDLVYPSLDDFIDVNKSVSESDVEKPTIESNESKTIRKENEAPIIVDWVYESEEEDELKF